MKRPSSAVPELSIPENRAAFVELTGAQPEFDGAGGGAGIKAEFCFRGFRLRADGTLLRGEAVVHLPPKELAALRLLLADAGQVVSPLQLKKALWGDLHVTADSVPKCVSSLRARLTPEECIQTVYKRGYRFSAEVRREAPAHGGPLPRLAILPFATEYGVPEYLGLAIAEETVARFTNICSSRVSLLARDSVFSLAQSGRTAQEVGEVLKADLVLTGTLRAMPAHYRLRAEMIRVDEGAQIWVEDILVPKSQVAGLESELVSCLESRMGAGGLSIAAAQEPAPQHREAYEIFQRARFEWQKLERHRMQDSVQHLTRATELDPSLIAAKIDLAHLCITQAFYGSMAPTIAAELVRRTADTIPDLSRQAEALLPALGWVSYNVDHNLAAALWAFSQSAHLPHDNWNTRERVMFALSRHRFDEAGEITRAALREDPFSPWLHARMAWICHLSGLAAESLEQIRRSIALYPDHDGVGLYGSMILPFNGDTDRGVELAQALALRQPHIDISTAVHAYALACAGRGDEARTMLERLQWLSRERFVIKSFNPAVYLALGEPETALAELRAAGEDRCPWFFQMLADPRLAALRGHPEFVEMQAVLAGMEAAAARQPELDLGS